MVILRSPLGMNSYAAIARLALSINSICGLPRPAAIKEKRRTEKIRVQTLVPFHASGETPLQTYRGFGCRASAPDLRRFCDAQPRGRDRAFAGDPARSVPSQRRARTLERLPFF